MTKIILPLFILLFISFPVLSLAQASEPNPIIPDCSPNCGYRDLIKLVDNIIKWIIMISVPVATGVIAWAGFMYMTTGVSDQKSEAKKMLMKVLKGFVFILAAWLIVTTILNVFLADSFKTNFPLGGVQ